MECRKYVKVCVHDHGSGSSGVFVHLIQFSDHTCAICYNINWCYDAVSWWGSVVLLHVRVHCDASPVFVVDLQESCRSQGCANFGSEGVHLQAGCFSPSVAEAVELIVREYNTNGSNFKGDTAVLSNWSTQSNAASNPSEWLSWRLIKSQPSPSFKLLVNQNP